MPRQQKSMSDLDKLRYLDPKSLREYLKDGNYGGLYQRDDEELACRSRRNACLADGRMGLKDNVQPGDS
jgi:hypothetical protein